MDFLQSLSTLPDTLLRLEVHMDSQAKALNQAMEQLGNTRIYEADAAKYLGVEQKTMYHYRLRGLAYEKVGRIISYYRKDLDAWRQAGKVHA